MTVTEPDQEDWGWYFDARNTGAAYFVGVGGNSDHDTASSNRGEWRLMVEKHRTLWDKLAGKNRLREDDEFLEILKEIVSNDPGMELIGIE
jgi:hypothetical protein